MTAPKDYSPEGKDRGEWDRRWAAMPHRRLSSPPKSGLGSDALVGFGDPASCTIFLDPIRFCDRPWRESECCPVCGGRATGDERLAASLHPRWASGLSIGIGVWVHRACFESCPDTSEPAPIPW